MKSSQARNAAMRVKNALFSSIQRIAHWTKNVCWYSGVTINNAKTVRYGTKIDNKLRYRD